MNRQDQAFSIGGLELLAAMLGQQNNMRVIFGGNKTCIDHTTSPMTIYLPGDLANTDVNRLIIEAKIYHESAHSRFTDFLVENWDKLVNILEDVRIERLMGQRYVGCKQVLHQRWDVMRSRMAMPSASDGLLQNVHDMIWFKMRHEILNHPLGDFGQKAEDIVRQAIPNDIVDKVLDLSRSASHANGKDTQHVSDCTEAILKLLYEQQSEMPQADPGDADDSSSEGESSQSDERSTDDDTTTDSNAQGDADDKDNDDDKSASSPSKSDATDDTDSDTETGSSDTGTENESDTDNDDTSKAPTGGDDEDGDDTSSKDAGTTPDDASTPSEADASDAQGDSSSTAAGQGDQQEDTDHPDNDTNDQASGGGYAPESEPDWQTELKASEHHLRLSDEDDLMDQLLERDSRKPDRVTEVPLVQFNTYAIHEAHSRRITNQLRSQLEGLLQAMALSEEYHVSSGGQLDRCRLHTLRTPNPKPFLREDEGEVLDTAIQFLIDGSISMDDGGRYLIANEAAFALAQATHHIEGVVSATAHFQGNYLVSVNRFDEKPDARKFGIHANGGTPMAMALQWSLYQLWPRSEARKIVIFLTDGQVGSSTVEKIDYLTKHGIECYGIGLGADLSHILPAKKQASIQETGDLPKAMFGVLRQALLNL